MNHLKQAETLRRKYVLFHAIGKNENKLLDLQEQIDNCKIIRQFKTLGYIVDGCCPETNTVYGVYEKKHLNQKEHDNFRQNQIISYLNCNFKIIWDIK